MDLARRLAKVRLVSEERDPIEALDRIEVARGTLRFAATSAATLDGTERLVAILERAVPELRHGVRVIEDDRPSLLPRRDVIARALRERPAPLYLAFTWRDRAPPRRIARLRIGPLLGYPRCCVAFEEDRRARQVREEARGMRETWRPRSVVAVLRAIDERRPYLAADVEPADERFERIRRFPFVSYVPCPRCIERGERSPAGRDNERRRQLAPRWIRDAVIRHRS